MSQLQQSTRQTVLERDDHQCQFCGVTEEQHKEEMGRSLDIHHVIPRRSGGSDSLENLISVCVECHRTLESTQGDALKRMYEKEIEDSPKVSHLEKRKAELMEKNSKLNEGIDQLEKDIEQLKQQIDNIHDACKALFRSGVKGTVYAVHEGAFTTSDLIHVGSDEEKAFKHFSESDGWATMEARAVEFDSLPNSISDSNLKAVTEKSESVKKWMEMYGDLDD